MSENDKDMNKKTKFFEEFIENNLTTEQEIRLWSYYCQENSLEGYIYENDEYFFDEYFPSTYDAIRAVSFGSYCYSDTYVCFNGYGNIDSFSYVDDEKSPICRSELAEWVAENLDDNEVFDDLNIEDEDILDAFREAIDDDEDFTKLLKVFEGDPIDLAKSLDWDAVLDTLDIPGA